LASVKVAFDGPSSFGNAITELAAMDYEAKLYKSKAEELLGGQQSSEARENSMLRETLGR
jgi:hypothetical protein